jgi:fermentation-respiration switch protein FrsA (DUF1100 family)
VRTAVVAIVAILVGVGLLKLLVVSLEPRLAFYPFPGQDATPSALGLAYEDLFLRTSDDERVQAWVVPHPQARANVLYWHGNGGNLALWLDVIAGIQRQGFTVLALDYRGYGRSTGSPSEAGLYRDADALLEEYWSRRHGPGAKTVYWGRSLGATVAAYATTVRAPDALVLESSFPDKRSLLASYPLYLLLNPLSRYRFPTSEFLAGYAGPALVVHGRADTIVPFGEGEKVYEQLTTQRKTLAAIDGADHNDLHIANPEAYWQRIRQFLDAALATERHDT